MKNLVNITNSLVTKSWDNGAEFLGQLDSVQTISCHMPTNIEGILYGNTGSLFATPSHRYRKGRGASS